MKIVTGKYNEAKIFTDLVEQTAIDQVKTLLDQPFTAGQTIRFQPDIHAGAGCVVGTTMTVTDKICPNLIGVDIGCGMLANKLNVRDIDFAKLDKVIREFIPNGMNIREVAHESAKWVDVDDLYCKNFVDIEYAKKSIGTLGGGNHFIELDKDSEGNVWLVIHSGSRHLGCEVAKYYQKQAIKSLHKLSKEVVKEVVEKMKAEGRHSEIQSVLNGMKSNTEKIPDDLCYCEGELFEQYVHDMRITQEFAMINRATMAGIILDKMDWEWVDKFSTIHNYLDTEHMVMRKGSVAAYEGERLLIPINMRDGSLICVGKGNADWNYSAPHGAGRIMSRAQAKKQLELTDYQNVMSGIWTTSVNTDTIDEAPMVYKPMESIVENIKDTAEVIDIIKPIYNFKASEA